MTEEFLLNQIDWKFSISFVNLFLYFIFKIYTFSYKINKIFFYYILRKWTMVRMKVKLSIIIYIISYFCFLLIIIIYDYHLNWQNMMPIVGKSNRHFIYQNDCNRQNGYPIWAWRSSASLFCYNSSRIRILYWAKFLEQAAEFIYLIIEL